MSQELENIPFYWTALGHWMIVMTALMCYPRRWGKDRTAVLSGFFLVLLMGQMALAMANHGPVFNGLMLVFAALTGLQVMTLTMADLRQALYHGTRFFIAGGFMTSLCWQFYVYYAQRYPLLESQALECVWMLVGYGAVCTVFFLMESVHRSVNLEVRISWLSAAMNAVTGVIIYILSSLSFTGLELPFAGKTYAEAFQIRTLVYFGGAALLYAVHLQRGEAQMASERDALQKTLDMQKKSLRLEQESVDLVNQKYHDMKHQIALLREQIGGEEKLAVLDRVEQEIRVYEAQNRTGNDILDTILTSKSIHCQREGIQLTCVADGQLLDFMEIADISALFGNALDNAIEAAGSVIEPDQRLVHLSVSRHHAFVRIRVENRFAGTITMRNGLPSGEKRDPRYHGYGLRSIRATAEKYGGSMTVETRDGWFELRVLIPLPETA